MMDMHVVLMVARQVEGEYVLIRSQQAFKDKVKAEALMQSLKSQYNKDGKQVPVTLTTPHGDVLCYCEIGVFEVNLED